jgi:hypothetical protein
MGLELSVGAFAATAFTGVLLVEALADALAFLGASTLAVRALGPRVAFFLAAIS